MQINHSPNGVKNTVATEEKQDKPKRPEAAALAWENMTVWQLMASDIRAWAKLWSPDMTPTSPLSPKDAVRLVWSYCGLRATLLYRLAHALWKSPIPVLHGIVTRLNITLYGFDIPANVKIGPGFYMPHPVGTVITADYIGANASVIAAVTIGMGNTLDFPRIGDNVFIGAGARVLGGITVGDNAKIGANAVVITDVPAGATALGVPAKFKMPNNNTGGNEESFNAQQ